MKRDQIPDYLPFDVANDIFWYGHADWNRDGLIIHICYKTDCPKTKKGSSGGDA